MRVEGQLTTSFSIGTTQPIAAPTTTIIPGTILIVMRASFHWTAMATMNEEKNSEIPVTAVKSFSAIPWVMRFPS